MLCEQDGHQIKPFEFILEEQKGEGFYLKVTEKLALEHFKDFLNPMTKYHTICEIS